MLRKQKGDDTARAVLSSKPTVQAHDALDNRELLLRLQRTAGNEAVTSLMGASPLLQRAAEPGTNLTVTPSSEERVVARTPASPTTIQEPDVKQIVAEAEEKADKKVQLREDLKSFVVLAVEKFGRACANQKDEIKAEAAEDKELFSIILDIGFSFVPGLLPLKRIADKGFKKGAEVAEKELEKVVEASLKGVQQGIMKVRGSHESELEHFIDHLADLKEEAAVVAIHQANKMTEPQLEATSGYYENYIEKGDPEGEIKSMLDAFKKSVRHVGEFRHWEFGASGQGEAVLIRVGPKYKLALVTFPSPMTTAESAALLNLGWQGEPVWLDWIPKEMESLTKEKSFQEFGPFKSFELTGCLVPPVYFRRWAAGLSN